MLWLALVVGAALGVGFGVGRLARLRRPAKAASRDGFPSAAHRSALLSGEPMPSEPTQPPARGSRSAAGGRRHRRR